MPIGSNITLPHIAHWAEVLQPKTVLDVGIGNGLNGAIIYNYATVLFKKMPVITGIEPWEKYRNPLWLVYDEILIQDLRAFEPKGTYDMILMTDVIEHLEKPEGIRQLERYKEMVAKDGVFIVSTPSIFIEQGAFRGNAYETHRSLWLAADFKARRFRKIAGPEDHEHAMHVYRWRNL